MGLFELCHDPWSSSRLSIGDLLLLRYDGNAGIPFPTKKGNEPSSQDEEGKPGLFLSFGRTLVVSLEWRRVCWATSLVASRVSRTLSRIQRQGGFSLERLIWERVSSPVEVRISWFFSSCSRKLGVPLEL